MWREIEFPERGPVSPDPCKTRLFMMNKYYDHGLRDPWFIHPSIAKNWTDIVSKCQSTADEAWTKYDMFPKAQLAYYRSNIPPQDTARPRPEMILLSEQKNQVYLAIEAKSTKYPHTE